MRSLLVSLLLASSVLAQAQTPYEVAEGDRVRIQLGSASPTPTTVEGRVAAVGADSLTISSASVSGYPGYRIAWRDVGRLERRGENRVGEAVGIAVGLVAGAVVGGLIAEGIEPHSFAYAGGGLLGGLLGMPVGAVVGANTRGPWVELPRAAGGGAVSFRVTLPLR